MSPILISAGNPGAMTGGGNNTWLLTGAEPTLIDAGVGAPSHVNQIASALEGRDLVRALVTHGHADHASGAPALRARWPKVELAKFLPQEGGSSAFANASADRRSLGGGWSAPHSPAVGLTAKTPATRGAIATRRRKGGTTRMTVCTRGMTSTWTTT